MNEDSLNELKKELQICTYLNRAHIIMSFFGFFGYIARKIFFILLINILSIILSVFGYYAIDEINKEKIGYYALFTSSLFGMTLLYEIIADLFTAQYETEAPSQAFVFLVVTLPFLVDFLSGLSCLKLSYTFSKFPNLEFKKKYNQIMIKQQEIAKDYSEVYEATNLCVVCLTKSRQMVFYRCGHKACCESCSKAFRSGNCPICRAKIEDCIQEYDA